MKSFYKINSVIIPAAVAVVFTSTVFANDIVIKPLRYQSPKSASTATAVSPVAMACPACKNEFVPTVTQDSKLKTKTVFIAKHGCSDCKTTIERSGAQKATGKDVARHSCGAMLAASQSCCGSMK